MGFNDKYVSNSEKLKEGNQNKIILDDPQYALVEAIYALVNKLEELRL